MEIIAAWAFLAALVGYMAATFNRSGFLYFVLSLILSPVIGLIVLLISGKKTDKPTPATHVKCPDCRELVLQDASKCKHCGCALVPQ